MTLSTDWLFLVSTVSAPQVKVQHRTLPIVNRSYTCKWPSVVICTDRDSSVGIATRYGLESSGIESRCGQDFPRCSRAAVGPYSLLYSGYRVFPGGIAAKEWHWSPTLSSAGVKEKVELYLFSPSGPSWSVRGWTLPYVVWFCCPLLHDCMAETSLRNVRNFYLLYSTPWESPIMLVTLLDEKFK